jgi:hypothetical protein
MLNMLEKLLSSGLFGDGVRLEVRPRFADLRPYRSVSWLFFLSGSLFSPYRLSMLGLRRPDGLRDKELLRAAESERSLGGIVSAKLGSVISRMSESERILGQGEALTESALGSERVLLLSMPP